MEKHKFIILWFGVFEWMSYEGTLSEAVEYIKRDQRFKNYGREGARIISAKILYEIEVKPVETYFSEKEQENECT